ncbi:L-threonylcarbamoyladenylate synthase [Methanococcus voltae]|uniref:L-threonylcarbamoyladenylate synthase n=1 Tax=Methanococcus voltae (strain ATCC BAA-1334 / A3) TaxID=456320 RepID=D7DQK2_METV3|nr:L-threonylcarbamoyladenylate synthase [Methanococcus voltae]MCS3901635.1 L-threonylcarbamoyladenylate synthase [Methanococcus voltae]
MKIIRKGVEITLNDAKKYLKNGEIALCPTDTIYGICGYALDKNVVDRIYKIKNRDESKPFSISLQKKSDIQKYAKVNNVAKKLINKFLPGPITLILPKKESIPDYICKDYVGIRIPDSKIILELSEIPITSTSANVSGRPSSYSISKMDKEILNSVDIIIDDGDCEYKKPSTIVKIIDNDIELIREGSISFDNILKELNLYNNEFKKNK